MVRPSVQILREDYPCASLKQKQGFAPIATEEVMKHTNSNLGGLSIANITATFIFVA